MNKIKAGIVGATGYAGVELLRLLLSHPKVEVIGLSSVSFEGQSIDQVYPNLHSYCGDILTSPEKFIPECDVVFASLPHGLSEPLARQCIDAGAVFIDLGADFRLTDKEEYSYWYKKEYNDMELHDKAVYCIPELHRDRIKDIPIIGNPGCYPTSIALGIAPAIKAGIIDTSHIIIDSKSGVTGAGRGLKQNTHYPEANEAFSAYAAGNHRHAPEIEQTLSEIAGSKVSVTFVPHLLPVNRGIESTVYTKLISDVSIADVRKIYNDAYENERFVRVLPEGEYANIRNVRFSNFCDISIHMDSRTDTLIISSVIDNMVKGAAGQAIQNMNIRFELGEDTALITPPPAF